MVRFALSVTIVEMVNVDPDIINPTNGTCQNISAQVHVQLQVQAQKQGQTPKRIKIVEAIGKKYNWTEDDICQIEASFFYGFAIGNLVFGLASDILGSKFIIG